MTTPNAERNSLKFLGSEYKRPETRQPDHWVVPDFGLLFPTKEAAQRYLTNINDQREPIACFKATPPALCSQTVEEMADLVMQGLTAKHITRDELIRALSVRKVAQWPDPLRMTARELLACCEAWEPDVCVMGNVRAKNAAATLRAFLAAPPATDKAVAYQVRYRYGEQYHETLGAWTPWQLCDQKEFEFWQGKDGAETRALYTRPAPPATEQRLCPITLEAAAKVCDAIPSTELYKRGWANGGRTCARAIRSLATEQARITDEGAKVALTQLSPPAKEKAMSDMREAFSKLVDDLMGAVLSEGTCVPDGYVDEHYAKRREDARAALMQWYDQQPAHQDRAGAGVEALAADELRDIAEFLARLSETYKSPALQQGACDLRRLATVLSTPPAQDRQDRQEEAGRIPPADLNRRVEVENVLLAHFKNRTSPTPDECRSLAYRLGVPDEYRSTPPCCAPWDASSSRSCAGGVEPVVWQEGDSVIVREDFLLKLRWQGPWVGMNRAIPASYAPLLYLKERV